MLGGWVNPHREQHTIPQGQTSILAQHISHSHSGIDEKRPTEKFVWLRSRLSAVWRKHTTAARLFKVRRLSLHKILFYFKALLWESIILLLPPHLQSLPYCNTIARLLCNIWPPPAPPPHVYAIPHTMLVLAISCKGQERTGSSTVAILHVHI